MSTAIAPPGEAPRAIETHETAATAVAARERASVEARYLVAMNRPRNFDTSRLRLMTACKRPRFAAVARYSKPIGSEKVQGLSIRFAEEAAVLWGNIDVTALLVYDDDKKRIYRVTAIDLETNGTAGFDVSIDKTVERRVVKEGQEVVGQRLNSQNKVVYLIRATEDEIFTKSNNLISKTRRNAILALIPADVKEECEEVIINTLRDRDAEDPEGARKDILAAFWTLGVTPDQVSQLLGKPLEQINPAELTLLRTIYTALKEGEATWEQAVETFGKKKPEDGKAPNGNGGTSKTGTEGLKAHVAGASAQPAPTTPDAGPAGPTPPPPAESDEAIRQQDLELVEEERRNKKGAK